MDRRGALTGGVALTTLRDIAVELGISVATVSNALTGKGRVSPLMRDRITDEARRRGYAPQASARALRTGRSGVIGLVLPDLTNPLCPMIAQAIQEVALAHGLGVMIGDSRGDDEAQMAALHRMELQGADGLIVVPRRGTKVHPSPLPVAVIDAESNAENTICADHLGGGAQVMRHLAGLGHRRILMVGHSRVSHVQASRMVGMLSALPTSVSVRQHWLEDGPMPDPECLQAQRITAVATTSDLIALPLLTQLQAAGLRVPDDIAITGFDNHDLAPLVAPGLTSVAQDTGAIARGAIQSLLDQLDNKAAPVGRTVAVRLIARGSTQTASQQGVTP